MKVLAIDTSNRSLGVGVLDNQTVVAHYVGTANNNHSVTTMPAIDFVMSANKISPNELDRIVVAQGPGSYTGLRIGVTTAKTLAWTLGIDLVGVSSLAAIAGNSTEYQGYIVPVFDARRDNVYSAVYKWEDGRLVSVIADKHLAMVEWLEELLTLPDLEKGLRFVGHDVKQFSDKISEKLPHAEQTSLVEMNEVNPITLAKLGLELDPIEDCQGFVPVYLKLVEAEEKWLETNPKKISKYVETTSYHEEG